MLARLDDFDNSVAAYQKALEMDQDYLTELNFAITLFTHGKFLYDAVSLQVYNASCFSNIKGV